MKQLILILLAVLFISTQTQAQTYKYAENFGKAGFDLKVQSSQNIQLTYSIHEFSLDDKEIRGEAMKTIRLDNYFLPGEEGAPDLPGSGRYIAVPQGSTPVLHIKSMQKEVIPNVNLAPSPRIPKDTERGPLDYNKNSKIYSTNAFYPAEPISLTEPTKIRGVDAVILGIVPFQYNPVTKELVVYRDIDIEVEFSGGNGHFGEDRLRSRWWEPILEDVFINYEQISQQSAAGGQRSAVGGQRELTGYEYLIICPDLPEFKSWADSLKVFRTMQGIVTGVVTTAEIGGNNFDLIDEYITNAYNNWDIPPAAVLLLGDYGSGPDKITTAKWDDYCVADHIYADVNDDDEEEIVFARMTAEDELDLETMVRKVIDYETNPPTNPDFYNHPITALGWQTERWFQVCSEVVGGYFKNVQGKDPVRINAVYQGDPSVDPWSTADNTEEVMDYFGPAGLGYIPATPAELGDFTGGTDLEINNALNAGAFLIQHRDHGYEYGWGEPNYDVNSIDDLTNTDLSFIFSINCLTGKYNFGSECFAEKIHRYTYAGKPAGALGLIAASETSYSFVNDVYVWGVFDNMFPDFMPGFGTTPPSRGELPAFGNTAGKIFLKYSSWPFNTENKEVTYNLFHHHGDAFTCLFSEVPQDLAIIHDPVQLAGSPEFTITADEGALIAISVNGELIGIGTGTGSPESIPIIAQNPPDMVDVVVTKQNYRRYHAKLQVIPPVGPYVIAESYLVDDAGGNNNGKLDYGESAILDINMKNLGYELAENVSVILSSEDSLVTIQDSVADAGSIDAGQVSFLDNAFSITAEAIIPNGHKINFNVEATNGEATWNSTFSIKVQAPVLEYADYIISDPDGNNNGRLDPGETVDVIVSIRNKGASDAFNVNGVLRTFDQNIIIETDTATFGTVGEDDVVTGTFRISALVITNPGHEAGFYLNFAGNSGIIGQGEFSMFIGLFPILIIDRDDNNNSADKIKTAIENWRVFAESTDVIPADLKQYRTVFLCLGTYNENHILTQNEALPFIDFLENGGNLYLEGADTWYYDQLYNSTTLHPMFNIDGLIDGNDDLGTINGVAGTMTQGKTFIYTGDNNFIDRIDPIAPAYSILSNSSPVYNVAIAYNAGTYKTIGSSFEFGGIVDNLSNTKKILMKDYLTFFGMEPISKIPVTPVGDTSICTNDLSSQYHTNSVEGALYYIWELSPPAAGTIEGWDTLVTVNWTPGYTGNTTLRVCGMNQNGLGPVSTSLLIGHFESPTATVGFSSTDICAGDTTYANILLTGDAPWLMMIDVGGDLVPMYSNKPNMEGIIFDPDTTTEVRLISVIDGNGCISIGFPSEWINVRPLPTAPGKPDGWEYVGLLSGTESVYTSTGADSANSYEWLLDPSGAGNLTLSDDGLECTVNWVTTFTGDVYLQVQGINDCGEGELSEPLVITVGNTYGVEEHGGVGAWGHGSLVVWPNPASGVLSVKCLGLSAGNSYTLVVYDIFGRPISPFTQIGGRAGDGGSKSQEAIKAAGDDISWTIDVSSLPPDIYFISVLNEGKRVAGGKFVVGR